MLTVLLFLLPLPGRNRHNQMTPTHHCVRLGHKHNRLCLVDHNRRTLYDVSNTEFLKEEDGSVIDTPDTVKVDAVGGRGHGYWDSAQLVGGTQGLELREYRGAKCIEGFAYAANLRQKISILDAVRDNERTNLDIINHNLLLIQQKPKLLPIRLLERLQIIRFSVRALLVFPG